MSSKWFTVPTREEVKSQKKAERKAKRVAECTGVDVDQALQMADRDRARREAIERAAQIEAMEKSERKKAEQEARKAAIKATAQRKADAVARSKLLQDPSQWPNCVERLAINQEQVVSDLEGLWDASEFPMLASNNGLRLEYVMAVVDRATEYSKLPGNPKATDADLEPLRTFDRQLAGSAHATTSSSSEKSNQRLHTALLKHFNPPDQKKSAITTETLLHMCAACFGGRGNRVVTHGKGEGLGARLVLQLALKEATTIAVASIEPIASLFFKGASFDASSAANVNLLFVLQNLTGSVSAESVRRCLVGVLNMAVSQAQMKQIDKLAPWFQCAGDRLHALGLQAQRAATLGKDDAANSTSAPMLHPEAAVWLASCAGSSYGPVLVRECTGSWQPRAARHVLPGLLKASTEPSSATALAVVRLIESNADLSQQLVTSARSAGQQVEAVLRTAAAEGVSLPASALKELSVKLVNNQQGGKGATENAKGTRKLIAGMQRQQRRDSRNKNPCWTVVKTLFAIVVFAVMLCVAVVVGMPNHPLVIANVPLPVREQLRGLTPF